MQEYAELFDCSLSKEIEEVNQVQCNIVCHHEQTCKLIDISAPSSCCGTSERTDACMAILKEQTHAR